MAAANAAKKRAEEAAAAKRKQEEEQEKLKREEEARLKAEQARLKALEQANNAHNTSMESSDSEEIDQEAILEGIKTNTIKQVNLRMEGLEDDEIVEVLTHLLNNTSVEYVNFDGNELGAPSFELLQQFLKKSNVLKYLSLNFVQLGAQGSQIIHEGLSANTSLKELAITGNDLFDSGMAWIQKGLAQNNFITTLVLSENSLMDNGCVFLASLMRTNQTITYLDLSNNYIEYEGAKTIAKFLTQNKTLKHLNLQRNLIQNIGCSALAAAIATKGSALEILDIANNIIETEGVLELCAGLRANTSLKTVCLRQNIFEIRGEIALQEVLMYKDGKLNLEWRNARTKDDTPLTTAELEAVVNHFGPQQIMKWYSAGRSLEPLVDIEVLLCSITWTQDSAMTFFKWAFKLAESADLLLCFNKILKRQIEIHSTDFSLGKIVAGNEDILRAYLQPPMPRLSLQHVLVFETFSLISSIDNDDVICHVTESSEILKLGTHMFFNPLFKDHSIFQHVYKDFILQLLSGDRPTYYILFTKLMRDIGFGWLMIHHFLKDFSICVGGRSSKFCHLHIIIAAIHQATQRDAKFADILKSTPDADKFELGFSADAPFTDSWLSMVEGAHKLTTEQQTVPEQERPERPTDAPKTLKADELATSDDGNKKKS